MATRVVKKRTSTRKRSSGSKKNRLKKDFYDFAKKIEYLELLHRELESLDTTGFATDVKLIKSKLKNVDAIPEIEEDLKALKKKIGERNKEWKRMGKFVDSRFADFIDSVKSEVGSRLKSDILTREKEFSKRYRQLVNEFHHRYRLKVNKDLEKDVRKKFDEKLKEALKKEKKELTRILEIRDKLRLEKFKKQTAERISAKLTEANKNKLAKKISELTNEAVRFEKMTLKALSTKFQKLNEQKLAKQVENVKKTNEKKLADFEKNVAKELEKEYTEKLIQAIRESESELLGRKSELEKHIKKFMLKKL